MIAIAGPLVVASRGLFGADISKNQMIASYLAQESMEAIKNIRDNNLYQGLPWLTGISGCLNSAPCDASAIDGIGQAPSIANGGGGFYQMYVEDHGYGHTATETPSPFSRKFYVHTASSNSGTISDCSSADECGVTVEVGWTSGTVPYKVIINSEITSTLR